MSSGSLKVRRARARTIIRDGKIVRLYKDGRVKAVLDDYVVKHEKQLTRKSK
jgi:hypothetical protein